MKTLTKKLAGAAALAIVLTMAVAGAAQADDWRGHERDAYRFHHAHPHPVYTQVYAPPVIYSPPPPPEPGLNLVIPLNFH
jgi:hypothetical protein